MFIFTLRWQYIRNWWIMFILIVGKTWIPQLEPHDGIKMAQVLGSPVYICGLCTGLDRVSSKMHVDVTAKLKSYKPGLSNLWPARQFCAARKVKCLHIFAELMKWWNQNILYLVQFYHCCQNSSKNLYNSPNFAPCGLPYDPTDRCVARGWFKLESPGINYNIKYEVM